MTLRFELPMRRARLAGATVNGQSVTWQQR